MNSITFTATCDRCGTVEEVHRSYKSEPDGSYQPFNFDTVVDEHFNKLGWWRVKVGPMVGAPVRTAVLCATCSRSVFRDMKFTPSTITLDPTFAISR